MNEVTLPSRHKIRNSIPGGPRTSTHPTSRSRRIPTILNLRVSGEKNFDFFEIWMLEWGSNPRSLTFQAGSFNHCNRAPDGYIINICSCRFASIGGSFFKGDYVLQLKCVRLHCSLCYILVVHSDLRKNCSLFEI